MVSGATVSNVRTRSNASCDEARLGADPRPVVPPASWRRPGAGTGHRGGGTPRQRGSPSPRRTGQEARSVVDILHGRRRSHVVGTRSSQRVVSGLSKSKQDHEITRLPPKASTEQIRDRFSRQRRTGTAPELALRRELHRRGWRYRVDLAPLQDLRRRRADVVFTRLRVALFVDGCFWHACPQHATAPKANKEWWRAKLKANVARDRDTDARLEEHGWTVIRVWEHEPAGAAADRIESILQARQAQVYRNST
jgi:DNA mismatch endonuclease, patch repair protein